MNQLTPYRYELDKTGLDPNNLVVDELHELPNYSIRCIAPTYGGFFVEGAILKDYITGQELIYGVDYKFGEILDLPSSQCAKEICAYVVIYKETLTKVTFTYQALGGNYSYSMDAIIEMLNSLDLGNRPAEWGLIAGRPNEFPPETHIHPSSDIYGMEYVTHSLERVRQAILLGDVASHDEIYSYIDRSNGEIEAIIAQLRADFKAHADNKENPHATTKAHVGLGSVENYAIATKQEAIDGVVNVKYMTPLRVFEAIDQKLIPVYQHINDRENPHGTTKDQVGLGNVQNFGIATQQEAQVGTSDAKYMTPLRVKDAIATQALIPLNAHIQDTNNPHATTKAQVGLSNVSNFGIATRSDAETGTSAVTYMTPQRVKEAITFQIGNAFNAHVGDTNNPHATTKAQIGLSAVQNFGIAAQQDAEDGTAANLYMTPQRVLESINKNAITSPNFKTDVTTTGLFKATTGFTFLGSPATTGHVWSGTTGAPQFDTMVNGIRVIRYSPTETTSTNTFAFSGVTPQLKGNNNASAIVRSTGNGDENAAGLMFHAGNYHSKLTMTSTGQFSFGGGDSDANLLTLNKDGKITVLNDVGGFSDPRLKKDMVPIENALGIVRGLVGFKFNWRDDIDTIKPIAGKSDYGFNAKEANALVPELTSVTPEGYLTMAYSKVIPFIANAVSELALRVEELEAKLAQ